MVVGALAAVAVATPAQASSPYDSPTLRMWADGPSPQCVALQGTAQHTQPFMYNVCQFADQLFTIAYYGIGSDNDNYYWIKSNHNGLCIDAAGTTWGSPVWSGLCNSDYKSLWHVEYYTYSDGSPHWPYMILENRASPYCLTTAPDAIGDPALTIIGCEPTNPVLWQLETPAPSLLYWPYDIGPYLQTP
jgi:hypothetical protein